jgi:WD40 repeat protein
MKALLPAIITLHLFFASTPLVSAQPEIRVQLGHSDYVKLAAISPNGMQVISYSNDNAIILWDVATGKELRRLEGGLGIPNLVAFSPDGKTFLVGFFHGAILLGDVLSGKQIQTISIGDGVVGAVAFSRCGRYLVSGSWDNSVKLWDISTGAEIQSFVGHTNSVQSVAISPDGKLIASGGDDKTAIVWDAATGKEVKNFLHTETVIGLTLTNNGKNLLTGSRNEIKNWDIGAGKELFSIAMPEYGTLFSIDFSDDGKLAIAGFSNGTIRLYDLFAAKEIRSFPHTSWVRSVDFSSDGKYALAAVGLEIIFWDLNTEKVSQRFWGYSNFVYSVAFSPDDKNVLSATIGRLCEWDLASGRLTQSIIGNKGIPKSIAFSPSGSALYLPDGNKVVAAYNSKSFKVWETSQWTSKLDVTVHSSDYTNLLSLAASPDGKFALTGASDHILRLWDLTTGQEIRSFKGHNDYIYSTTFSPDGKYILSGDSNGRMKLWNTEGEELHTFTGHKSFITSLSFFPNGKTAISASLDGTIKIWDLSTKQEVRTLSGHMAGVTSAAISPDGKYILSGSIDQSLKIWDAATGNETHTLQGHFNIVRSVAFSHNGHYALSGSDDGTIRVWDAKSGKLIYSAISTKDGDHLAWTPDGYFEGSQELAKEAVFIVNGTSVIKIDQLFEQFYQPGIIAARMEGAEIAPQGINLAQIKLPPQVKITSPTNNEAMSNAQLVVTVQATDMGSGIDEIRLYLNGKLIDGTPRGLVPVSRVGATQTKTFTIPMVDGVNTIRATAFNNQRTESLPHEITISYKAPAIEKPNMYIVAVGINNYQNPRYNLNFAVNDANAFVGTLKSGAKDIFGNITVLTVFDAIAKRAGILAAIDKVKAQAKPIDVFVFYYAGHGVMSGGGGSERPEFYLVPHDVTKMYEADDLLKKLGISAREIADFSKSIQSQKQLYILDACQSGGALQSFAMRGAAEEKAIAQLSRSTGTYFIAASGTEQFATEVATLGHGVFTYSIIEALKGACKSTDGRITVNQLKGCVESLVPELSAKYKGTPQYPTGYGFGQDFPIVILK